MWTYAGVGEPFARYLKPLVRRNPARESAHYRSKCTTLPRQYIHCQKSSFLPMMLGLSLTLRLVQLLLILLDFFSDGERFRFLVQ